MKKFEYKTFQERLDDNRLNSLGEEGWELVTHSVAVGNYKMAQYYVFKREKKQDEK